ncbi:hypothetical protein DXC92_19170 [Clostridiales bacterium TF09-2AC]|nr:hypothetical protein DXC92_19170 [Clostridiales bacterium TF09-2AC]
MAHIPLNIGAGSGSGSDDCTSTLDYVLAGKTAITKDSNDEPGNGRMTVNSLLSFSCAAYSGRRVLAKWQNPKAAIGKPYSGVYIRYSTSGYPGKTGGTQIYKGAGSNTASQGQSQAYLDMPALNTTYYLSCTPYVTSNMGDLLGDTLNATVKTQAIINKTFTATGSYTIPAGYSRMDIFCVGGGGGGGGGSTATSSYQGDSGAGGGGGHTRTVTGIAVSSGQVLAVAVGAGGVGGKKGGSSSGDPGKSGTTGGTTSVTRSGSVICSAAGGIGGDYLNGGSGGSGGAGASMGGNAYSYDGSNGGTDGGSGGGSWSGKGQGTTTRAWEASSGTQYSGGGGSGGTGGRTTGGAGGDRGGGRGGNGMYTISSSSEGTNYSPATAGSAGSANTGGGGGGGGGGLRGGVRVGADGGNGGSGVVLIKIY